MDRKAFTIIEAMITLLIISIVFAITTTMFSAVSSQNKLKTSSRSVITALRTARSHAITDNADRYVFFDPTTSPNEYYISTAFDGGTATEIGKHYKLPTGITFSDIAFDGGSHHSGAGTIKAVCFLPTGQINAGAGGLYLDISGDGGSVRIQASVTTGSVQLIE